MALTTADQVADFFLLYSKEHGDVMTNLKLQKLVYYAQAWYLALYGEALFDDELEAWVHGPVIYSVYSRFSHYRWDPIPFIPEKPKLKPKVINHLKEIYEVFGGFSAFDLERMTHNEDPWNNARVGLPIDQPSCNIISHQDMADYYSKLAEQDDA